jgi:hypothetical protein
MGNTHASISIKTRRKIIEAIKAGVLSRNAIAKKYGVSHQTVTNIATAAGIKNPFDRSQTEAGTRAAAADMAARRTELAKLLLDDAFELRGRARSPYTYYERGVNGPVKVTLDLPPLRETREGYTALAIAVDKHHKLVALDSDVSGLSAVDAWLRDMIGDAAAQAAQQAS